MSNIKFKDNKCPHREWGTLPSPPNIKKRICLACKKIQTLRDYSEIDQHGKRRKKDGR